MELLQLQYFQTVARLEHMTQAADELNVTQPALSRTISRLEEDLGVHLFDRKGRQIRLNSFGKVFLSHLERAFAELEEAERKIRDLAGLDQGIVSIGITNASILPALLSSFLARHPEVHFRQYLQSPLILRRQLENGEVDFCISNTPIEGTDIEWKKLVTEELLLLVPREDRFIHRSEIYLREVANENFINMHTSYDIRDITDKCLEAGFTPNITLEGNDPLVIGEMVSLGLGVSFVSELTWRRVSDLLQNRLHVLRIIEPNCQRTIGVARLKGRYLSKAAQAFYHFMTNYF
ncbi:LysR family transcriptional regulator [Effusibacillus dendaii]|uniref:LysR family transcriptional regulator n=1 Tax=Effusibacillus dendaii TaxID=2743772 RepID=A0A7I8DCR4_9BACL|nr:LysR family transcriptional regulator [Effusibacillus dendaii]BCJ87968.1 LysR family transcriptional regulator [Effusibacillus dendaii]